MPVTPTLIITLALDKHSHIYFTELRNKYFPAHCNYMEAHLTFFHKLPTNELMIEDVLKKAADRKAMNLEVTGIKNIGTGNVFTIASKEMQQLHKTMQKSFAQYLTTKDRKKLWPHVTVQNKVTAFKAKQTTEILLQDFKTFTVQAIGFSTWCFNKNIWQHQHDYLFKDAQ